jgi:hypothetical protein
MSVILTDAGPGSSNERLLKVSRCWHAWITAALVIRKSATTNCARQPLLAGAAERPGRHFPNTRRNRANPVTMPRSSSAP